MEMGRSFLDKVPRYLSSGPDGSIPNAIVEAHPVFPCSSAGCVAVANSEFPSRNSMLLHIVKRSFHSLLLFSDAAALPFADQANIQKSRILDRWGIA